MGPLPRRDAGAAPLRLVRGAAAEPMPLAAEGGARRVASASAWTLGSMAAMSAVRLASQAVLTHLCLPEHFGVVMLMRTFLTFVEMVSDMGIRNAVIAHPRGEERSFLGTAFSVQFLRGLAMWLVTCAIAWPAAAFYDAPLLLMLLPLAGLESVNNGLYAVRAFVAERRLKLAVPTLLDVLGLVVSVGTSVVWAWFRPGPWALALGPLAGGSARTLASHAIWRAERVGFAWERETARDLFSYSRWIIGSTMASFVAQQFHLLYLGKFLAAGVLGVYGVAWSLCLQASKPMTALANRVIIPLLAEARRRSPDELESALHRSLARFLPACLLVCVGAGLFAAAMFGLFFDASFVEGGSMGRLFAVVVWFMILQQVPRCALLALGTSRGVASMAWWNATLTVAGIVAGYAVHGGWLTGAILGNALGNVAGCLVGWRALRASGLHAGRAMAGYSLGFLALLGAGVFASEELVALGHLSSGLASAAVTAAFALPLAAWVWRSTIMPSRARSGS
jgi:O-antigen/teichoic acid export membrane protein